VSSARRPSFWSHIVAGPFFWLLPALTFLLLFYTWPLIDVIRLSFTDTKLIGGGDGFTLNSYRRLLLDPATTRSLTITLTFAAGSVVLKLVIGMLLALALDSAVKRGLKGVTAVRTSIMAAWVIPGVIVGILWKILLSTSAYGILNYWIISAFGTSIPFLTDARMAVLTTILANVWRGVAFTMIILYAGLQRIPAELYEAAIVDGANALGRFRYVTLPMLVPVIFVALVLMTISSVNTFDLVVALTDGGPARATEVIGLTVYQHVFKFMNLGRGAALAVLLLVINLAMTGIYLLILRANRETD
jgi:multiple sugar transport system permease protein